LRCVGAPHPRLVSFHVSRPATLAPPVSVYDLSLTGASFESFTSAMPWRQSSRL
jgi:hypothetical protein